MNATTDLIASGATRRGDRTAHRTRTRVLLLSGLALWLFLAVVPIHLMKNDVLVYVWIVLGAALVPAAVLWSMAHRLLPGDRIAPSRL